MTVSPRPGGKITAMSVNLQTSLRETQRRREMERVIRTYVGSALRKEQRALAGMMKKLPRENALRYGIGSCFETTLVYFVLRAMASARPMKCLQYEPLWEQPYPNNRRIHADLSIKDTRKRRDYVVEVKWAYENLSRNIEDDIRRLRDLLRHDPKGYGGYLLLLRPKYEHQQNLDDFVAEALPSVNKRLQTSRKGANATCGLVLIPTWEGEYSIAQSTRMQYFDDDDEPCMGRFYWTLLRAELMHK